MISCFNIIKKYKDHLILNDITISFENGKTYGIIGRNGSGKTVFLKCLCGLIPVTSGYIKINDKIIGEDVEVTPNTGIIIEEPGFLLHYSGLTNLKMLSSIYKSIPIHDIKNTMLLVGLDPYDKKTVGRYSMGMRQRLGIAQAIMEKPSLLILDEPMNGLDDDRAHEIRNILNKLKNSGTTIIIATHNLEDIEILCDVVYEMNKGTLKFVG